MVAYSASKYLKYNTSFERTTTQEEMVLYPSISFCKKWTFDNYIDELILDEDETFSDIRDLIASEVLDRKRVIYFLR